MVPREHRAPRILSQVRLLVSQLRVSIWHYHHLRLAIFRTFAFHLRAPPSAGSLRRAFVRSLLRRILHQRDVAEIGSCRIPGMSCGSRLNCTDRRGRLSLLECGGWQLMLCLDFPRGGRADSVAHIVFNNRQGGARGVASTRASLRTFPAKSAVAVFRECPAGRG